MMKAPWVSVALGTSFILGLSVSTQAALMQDGARVAQYVETAEENYVRVADGDDFYTFDYSDDTAFEQGQQRYQNENGDITNFTTELLPILPIEQEGGSVYLRGETIETPGSTYGFEDGRTGLQIEFKF